MLFHLDGYVKFKATYISDYFVSDKDLAAADKRKINQ